MRCLAALAASLMFLAACSPAKLTGTELNGTEAPDFTLTDGMTGKSLTLSSLRGKVVALAFLYTNCPDVCPLTASQFKRAQETLGAEADRVSFVAVSVDPERDTPVAVQAFSAARGLRASWHYLIGTRQQLTPVWAAYGIGVQAASNALTHNDAVYLIDRRGRERTLLHSEDLAADLTTNLRELLRESSGPF